MTKLEQLIKELCPNGVEYKKLGDIATYSKNRISSQNVDEKSYVGVDNLLPDRGGKTISNCVPEEGNLTRFDVGDILIGNIRPYLKKIWLADIKGGTNGDVLVIHIVASGIAPKYLYYALSSDKFFLYNMKYAKGAKMPRGDKEAIMKYVMPIPPIEIQEEVVTLLDDYTIKNDELCNSLEQELTARKKQYEYYRDLLLDFGVHGGGASECEWQTLGTVIISLKTGLNPRQNFSLNENGSNLPYITGKDIYDNAINVTERTDRITTDALALINKRANLESGLLLFASTGTGTVGRMAIIQEYNNDWGISETLYAIKVNENIILTSFLLHYLYSASAKSQFEPKISKGSVPHLKVKDLENVKVPIISLEEQTRIVSILDHFDKLCNDISKGLPAEIEARRKQYEYYRDKLLSFKEQ